MYTLKKYHNIIIQNIVKYCGIETQKYRSDILQGTYIKL